MFKLLCESSGTLGSFSIRYTVSSKGKDKKASSKVLAFKIRVGWDVQGLRVNKSDTDNRTPR